MDKKLKISLLLDFYGDLLSNKQREILDNYYNHDFSLSEIADNLEITRQGVFDNLKRAENKLIKMESNIGLYSRYERMQSIISKINDKAVNIINENKNDNNNINIENNANEIINLVSYLKD